MDEVSSGNNQKEEVSAGGTEVKGNAYIKYPDIYEKMKNEEPHGSRIPPGKKDGVYFLVTFDPNEELLRIDDRGPYRGGYSNEVVTYWHQEGEPKPWARIYKNENGLWTRGSVKKKVIEPQPSPEEIIEFRYVDVAI